MHRPVTKISTAAVQTEADVVRVVDESYKQMSQNYVFADGRDKISKAREELKSKQREQSQGQVYGEVAAANVAPLPPSQATSSGRQSKVASSVSQNSAISGIVNEAVGVSDQGKTVIERCDAEQLLKLSRAAYAPNYVDINKRIRSYSNWTNEEQNPASLAEAGFYATGDEDRVRCFMCNGGLYNFDKDDIPWYEHYRWFGNCAYIKQCMKNPVVAAIVDTAERIQGQNVESAGHNHGSGTTQCDLSDPNQPTTGSTDATQQNSPIVNTVQPEANVTVTKAISTTKGNTKTESLIQENEELRSRRTCKICLERDIGVIFLPCRHLVCCLECSLSVKECPICRSAIQASAKVQL